MIITLAGHVDHGKTSLVRALTGVDTDRLAEEKRRGLTIDLGFAYADFGSRRVGFVDVPGHHKFVHNMVAGVAARQTALIAVAADDGVMPQTREHLGILELIGVRRALVAITKADRVDARRLDQAAAEVDALLDESPVARVATVITSTATGLGIDDLRDRIESLAEDAAEVSSGHGFRMAIDRSFNVRGAGLVVTGTVHSGSVRESDELLLAPRGVKVKVRGIRVQDRPSATAAPGDRCALNLTGLDTSSATRGDWVVAPSAFAPTTRVVVALRVARQRARPVRHWLRVHAYHATSHSEGHLALLDTPPIAGGDRGLVELVLDEPFNPKRGDRIVVRDHGMDATLGGGEVIDIAGPARHRRSPARIARLHAQAAPDAARAIDALLECDAVDAAEFQACWNVTDASLDALYDAQHMIRLERDGKQLWESRTRWQSWLNDASERIAAYHKAAPHSPGLKRDQLRQVTDVPARWLDTVVASLIASATIKDNNGFLAHPAHRPKLPDADERLLRRIERALVESEQPPSLGDLGKLLKVDLETLKAFVQRMSAEGRLVRVADKRVFMPEFVARMMDIALALHKQMPDGFSARDFRDASGIGRNLVIDLLEHFDRHAFTRRYGDLRRVVGEPGRL